MDSCRSQQSQGDESQKNPKPLSALFWADKFYATVGNVPWEKLLEKNKNMHQYKDTLEWNDSEVEKEFNDAKKQFLNKIDGLSYYMSLRDPDAYIDEIDRKNSSIGTGPELVSYDQKNRGKGERRVVFGGVQFLSGACDKSEEDSKEDVNKYVDYDEDDLDQKEAADIVGFDSNIWNKPELKINMIQELVMGCIFETPLW